MMNAFAHAQTNAAATAQPTPADPIQIAVWPGMAPGETTSSPGTVGDTSGNVVRMKDVTSPQLFVYPLAKGSTGPTVMVCPGGGYGILAADLEGSEIAHWLNKLGYVVAVLHYRVPDKRDAALEDGQRALSILRERSKEFGIDPKRLGIMGFSAGGHLSARLALSGNKRTYTAVDDTDKESCGPDFAMLIYPAYLTVEKGSSTLSPEIVPTADMPPMFLAQTSDDPYFDVVPYAKALKLKGDSVRCFVYAKGGHGYGLRATSDIPASHWSIDAAQWLQKKFPTGSSAAK